jgi:hypothetical protein
MTTLAPRDRGHGWQSMRLIDLLAMSNTTPQKAIDEDPTKCVTDALEAVEVVALSDVQLRRLHAALTYMHEVLAKETERRAENDESGDTVRVASAKSEAD